MRFVTLVALAAVPALAQTSPQTGTSPSARQAVLEQECRRGSRAACREAEQMRSNLTGSSPGSTAAGGAGPPGREESFRLEELTAPPSQSRPGNNVGE
jgi:hypothetical protein